MVSTQGRINLPCILPIKARFKGGWNDMEFNWLGVAFVSEDLPCEIEEMVNQKMEELREEAMKEFDAFLDRNDLEQVMGVVVRKGSVK